MRWLVFLSFFAASTAASSAAAQATCDGQRIRHLTVRGGEPTLLQSLRVRVGDVCTDAAVDADVQRLWDLDRFDDVAIEGTPAGSSAVDLVVHVHARPPVAAAPLAAPRPFADPDEAYRNEVSAELAFGFAHDRAGAVTIGPGGLVIPDPSSNVGLVAVGVVLSERLRITRSVELRIELPFVPSAPLGPDGRAHAASGNPFAAASWLHDWASVRLRVGGGLTVPVAPFDGIAQDAAIGVRGGEEPWLAASRQMAFVGLGSLETRGLPLYASIELAGAGLVPLDKVAGPRVALSARGAIAWRPIAALQVGTRVAAVWGYYDAIGMLPAHDHATVAVTPYVRLDLGEAFFDLGLTLSLDDPYGVAFDAGAIWAVRVAGGVRF